MAMHFTRLNPGEQGRNVMHWGLQTIAYTMHVKAERLGKAPTNPDSHQVIAEVAASEAKRLYIEVEQRANVPAAYLEAVLAWCQDHLGKN